LDLERRKTGRGENFIMMNFITCSSPNIVRVIKSRRMNRARHVGRMGEGRVVYRFSVVRLEVKRPMGGTRRRW
jgi:ribosomal protein L15E